MKAKWLANTIKHLVLPARKPDLIIGEPYTYLHHWHLIPRNKWFNIYYHRYYDPDSDAALHDHPWKSVSVCLNGTLHEQIGTYKVEKERTITVGNIIYRSETFAHRLYLGEKYPTPETLFIAWRKVREWGFYCPNGWVDWRKFVRYEKTSDGVSTNSSAGCGEH